MTAFDVIGSASSGPVTIFADSGPPMAVTLLDPEKTPSGGSARNRWSGVIREMEPVGRLTDVIVDIGAPLRALVTPGSVDELGLAVGGDVVAMVKASSVRVVAQ